MTLAWSLGCTLGKDLRIREVIVQLVKHKVTAVYLHYIYCIP